MFQSELIESSRASENLLAAIDAREIVLWLQDPLPAIDEDVLLRFLGLPWRAIVSESQDKVLNNAATLASAADPLVHKRGYIQVVDSDPSRLLLPERSLPIYLLNGSDARASRTSFDARLRQMTMLEAVRRAEPKGIVVLCSEQNFPTALQDLWDSGFRSFVTFVSQSGVLRDALRDWVLASPETIATLISTSSANFVSDCLARYESLYPLQRRVLRVRDYRGEFRRTDVTDLDDPQNSILDRYELLEERSLSPLTPSELPRKDFDAFFSSTSGAWLAYAAGVPWIKDSTARDALRNILRKLDSEGAEAGCIAYITSEPGAGGTTLARQLAWEAARDGYPALLARQLPFVPDPLPIANFLTRVNAEMSRSIKSEDGVGGAVNSERKRRYETPWILVFDTLHSQFREGELLKFRKEMKKAGRPVCILVVVGSSMPIDFMGGDSLKQITELNHAIGLEDSQALGKHLNRFLSIYGRGKSVSQWNEFYKEHTVRYLDGIAAFWVALSFWLQGHYDLSESIQEWIYKAFKNAGLSSHLKKAILRIAALSSERLPLPETLLPASEVAWPTSHLLEDARQSLAPIGLTKVTSDGTKYWAIVHDILARLLLNAVFFDNAERELMALGTADDPEHLRFLLLREIAQDSKLGERDQQTIAEDFATTIFKIDPDHGHGNFLPYWREVLDALDGMPAALRSSNRLFLHHASISRRRIAKLDARLPFAPSGTERISLIQRAINDLKYALDVIEMSSGAETNLNLLNSLANAYLDLADVEADQGSDQQRQAELRKLANDATRRAYTEDPSNSFTVETYIKNLLQLAKAEPENAGSSLVEALGVAFSAISSSEREYRRSQLSSLADRALELLMRSGIAVSSGPIGSPLDVLLLAWKSLAENVEGKILSFGEFPSENRRSALEVLKNPVGRDNLQVIQFAYHLTCIEYPLAFAVQLGLVQQLVASNARIPVQLKLEYAVLLYQCDRPHEGDRQFRALRQMWREGEYFVQVPERLQWLWSADHKTPRIVPAVVGSGGAFRTTAQVQALASAATPFRPEEMSMRSPTPGTKFMCCVSFGHNGPFLRPVTASSEAHPSAKG
jgi:hypothetical protein